MDSSTQGARTRDSGDDYRGRMRRAGGTPKVERLCSSIEVNVVQTVSYINYELASDLSGPGFRHCDVVRDVGIMALRVPRGDQHTLTRVH